MSFPIPVTMTVEERNIPVTMSVSESVVAYDMEVETQIVAGTVEEYDGPYTVTPSEQTQTLETADKLMAQDVSVDAIPSNYVGSSIPRRTVNDVSITKQHQQGRPDNAIAVVLSGYYQSQVRKVIPTGTATTPYTNVTATPEITVSSSGLITANVSTSKSVTPTISEGYVMEGTAGTVSVDGLKNVQLSTQAGTTITPTESEQTAVAAQKFTTGEVKVAAIPSDYIGSEVPQKSSSDMTASGATVTAPAGYYAESASASVPNATWKNASTVGVVPEISVDANGLITANCAGWTSIHPLTSSGYADADTAANIQLSGVKTSQLSTQAAQTITPTTADQTIDSGKYLTGAQTIKGDANLLAENIKKDVTIFNVVGTHEGGLPEDTLLKALRNQTTSVEDDTLTSIRSYGLAYLTALASVSFPNLQTINAYAFYNDYAIDFGEGWPFPKAKSVGNYAFRYCYGLKGDIVLPSTVTSIGQYSFANCDHMETFTATGAITTLGTYTFIGASGHVMALREIHLPNLGTSIALNSNFGSTTAANACQHLEVCDIGKSKSIAANTFANCYKLQTLIMRRTSVTTCANVSAFLNTPLRGQNSLTAKIYVPEALIDSYKAASVWSTIDGYGYVEWCKIEGSTYEL